MSVSFRILGTAAVLGLCSFAVADSTRLEAQSPDPQCGTPAGGGDERAGGDACQKALDLFGYMTPQIGMLIAGGNAALGQASVLGGPGRFSIGVRANVTGQFRIPDVASQDPDAGPVRQSTFAVDESAGGFPVVDAAVGLFGGLPLGVTRVGGVDVLVNIFYLPESMLSGMEGGDLTVGLPGGGLELGWGLRVGLLQESAVLPGVSFSYFRRGLPALDLVSTTAADGALPTTEYRDTLSLTGFSLQTSAWRVVVGKSLAVLSVAAGVGEDRYSAEGRLRYLVEDGPARAEGTLDFSPSARAQNTFVDVSLNLAVVRISAEVGRVRRSGIETFNRFDVPVTEGASYAAFGLRFGH